MSRPSFHYDVCISYANVDPDQKLAYRLKETLQKANYQVFCDENLVGKDVPRVLASVFGKESRYCVVLASRAYLKRKWTQYELTAIRLRIVRQKGKDYLFPLQVERRVELPGLENIGWANNFHELEQSLLRALKKSDQIIIEGAPAYAQEVLRYQPRHESLQPILASLANFETNPKELIPPNGESLRGWLQSSSRLKKPVAVTLVAGESHSDNRLNVVQRKPNDGMMTSAGSCDAVSGAKAAMSLFARARLPLRRLQFEAVLDEWPKAARLARTSHLIVVGTGEVNLLAHFLNRLGHQYSFGQPNNPDPTTFRYFLNVADFPQYSRSLGGEEPGHFGGVLLLRNPWNTTYRVLWIAGLSGIATTGGCQLISTGFATPAKPPGKAIGLVYRAHGGGGDVTCDVLHQLIRKSKRAVEWI
ncbi:MAG: toll/interleukin-1 receptor domain-containing protein [Gemmataceae bacterium]|nr:toll/interleukin-1 receptor domain-containing protein [Gemmataceae bacterium]